VEGGGYDVSILVMRRSAYSAIFLGLLACTHPTAAPDHAAPAGSGSSAPAAAPAASGPAWQLDRSTFDTTTAPCTDFYQYVCGGFVAKAQLPADRTELDWARDAAVASTHQILQALLTGTDAAKPEDASDLTRLRTFFASCMAGGDAAERTGRATLAAVLATVDAIRARGDVQPALRKLHQAGFAILFQYVAEPDPAVRTKFRGEIELGKLAPYDTRQALRDRTPASDGKRATYRTHVEAMLALTGEPAGQARGEAQTVLDIASQLAVASAPSDGDYDPSAAEHPMPPGELARLAPHLDWPAYLAMVGHTAGEPVNVQWPAQLKVVDGLLASRPLADLRAFLRWRVIDELGAVLPGKLAAEAFQYTAGPGLARPARTDECELATVRAMGVELSRQYAARALGTAARDRATTDAQQVQAEIAAAVATTPWLSPAARAASATKITTLLLKVGFPTSWPATDTAPVSKDDLVANALAARRFAQAQSWQRVHAEHRRDGWENEVQPNGAPGMAAARLTIPNGFPDGQTNSIVFTAAFLRAPIYDASAPLEVRLGGFGAVVGHELMHSLDNYEYDDHGELHDVWTDADKQAHKAGFACVIRQANAYTQYGAHPNGERAVYENNADYGGVRHTYAALAKVRGAQLQAKGADGFTGAQRFFITYAQHWCHAERPEGAADRLRGDNHGPPPFRVNAPLANLPEFAQAFACPAGAAMARPAADRCVVW
jgi:putative endopeptidase